jgi:SMODS and SLOG-associating 2TM effector domain 1
MTDQAGPTPEEAAAAERARTDELQKAYDEYRVRDQIDYYERRTVTYERALRRTMNISAVLLVLAALCGSLGAVDSHRRGMWAFLAASLAALATAVATYEAAFGFEPLARQYRETAATLRLAEAKGPRSRDAKGITDYVDGVERLLRDEVDRFAHLKFEVTKADESQPGAAKATGAAAPPPPKGGPPPEPRG